MLKGLEEFRQMMRDDSLHIAFGLIKVLHLAKDRSFLKVRVSIFPEERDIIARMSWDAVGPESGIFQFPVPNDMVLVAMTEGDDDQAVIIRRLTSQVDKIPLNATFGHLVLKSLKGKKVYLTSDTRVNLSKGDTDPTENIVLGQVFKTLMSDILAEFRKLIDEMKLETHTGNLGFSTGIPDNAANYETSGVVFDNKKSSPVDDEAVLSALSFTEK